MGKLKTKETYIFMGARVVPLLLSTETEGNFSVFEFTEVKGLEPPFHIHETEDEIWRIVDGEAAFYLDDQQMNAATGDTIFVPKGTPHTFKLKTDTVKAILSLTAADFETVVSEVARSADSKNQLPNTPPTMEQVQQLVEIGKRNGLTILKPE